MTIAIVYVGARLGYHPLQTVLQARNTVNSNINEWFRNMYKACFFQDFFFEILILPIGIIVPRRGIPSIQNYWFEVPHKTINYTHTHTLSQCLRFFHARECSITYLTTVPPVSKRWHSWNQWRKRSQEVTYIYIQCQCVCVSLYICVYLHMITQYPYIHMYRYLHI